LLGTGLSEKRGGKSADEPVMTVYPAAQSIEKVGFRLARTVGMVEDWIGVVFVATVTLSGTFGLIGKASDWQNQTQVERNMIVIGSIGWLFLDLWYTARLIHIAVRRRRPFALTAACERRVWPLLFRPLAVVWWLGHFVTGALCAVTLHIMTFKNTGPNSPGLDFLMAIGFGFAANGFLMLAVCAATRSARVRIIVWKFRGLIDIGMGLTGVLFSQLLRSQLA